MSCGGLGEEKHVNKCYLTEMDCLLHHTRSALRTRKLTIILDLLPPTIICNLRIIKNPHT